MTVPLWFRRDITLGMTGYDVDVVRAKLGFIRGLPYDRSTMQMVIGLARKRNIDTDGEVNQDVAEELGDAADAAQTPEWFPADGRPIQLWDEGEHVRTLNKLLGFTDNDNRFHPEHEAAVRRLQSALDLPVTGQVNADLSRRIR